MQALRTILAHCSTVSGGIGESTERVVAMGMPSGLEARRADGADRKDKRVVRTEKAMRAALFKLLQERDYEKITVSALAREAGIDRKTFYLHYGSVDDLARSILRERTRALVGTLVASLEDEDAGGKSGSLKIAQLITAFCDEMSADASRLRSQLRHIPLDMFLDNMPELLTEAFVEDGRIVSNMPDEYKLLCASFVSGGILAAYRRWVMDVDARASVDQVAELLQTLVFEGLQGVDEPRRA